MRGRSPSLEGQSRVLHVVSVLLGVCRSVGGLGGGGLSVGGAKGGGSTVALRKLVPDGPPMHEGACRLRGEVR